MSGYLLQTFFHNPIAGPFVLGISSGAKMVVALVMVFFLGRGRMVNSAGMIAAAFAGAMLSMGFVLLMSRRIRRMSMLVVSGVMIGYICSAVTELVVTFAQDADIVNLHNWSLGSFSGTTWSSVRAACICVTVIFVLVFLMSKPLSAYQLGESYALNLGVNVRLLRIGMVVFSSILSACVVAFAVNVGAVRIFGLAIVLILAGVSVSLVGGISFVGLIVPHMARRLVGTDYRRIAPAAMLLGAVLLVLSDVAARMIHAPFDTPVGALVSVIGVPVFLLLTYRNGGARL